MRILTFTSLFPDTTRPNWGVYIYQRMLHVSRRPGNSVTAITPVPYAPFWLPGKTARGFRAIPAVEQYGEILIYHPRYLTLPKIGTAVQGLLMFLCCYPLIRKLASQGIDCIDAHFVYPDGFAAVLAGKLLGIPVIASARGTDINLYPTYATVRPFLKWTVRHAHGLIGVCTALCDIMVELGAPRDHVKTIGNGVDSNRFHALDPQTVRSQLGIPAGSRIILAVGTLIPRKGYHLLIPAIAELKQRGLSVRLYIAGEGDYRPTLEQQVRRLGLDDDVVFLGALPNDRLKEWYSAADVSCLASSREGWANVLLESMACGTPVVATRLWGTPEVVVSDKVGLLVEQNTASIADGLYSALTRPWDRAFIAASAQKRSWEVVATEVEEWINQRAGLETPVPAPVTRS